MATVTVCDKHIIENLNEFAAKANKVHQHMDAEVLTSAALRVEQGGDLENMIHVASEDVKAILLHSLDLFINESVDGKSISIPEDCTHFTGLTPPTLDEVKQLYADIADEDNQIAILSEVNDLSEGSSDGLDVEFEPEDTIGQPSNTAPSASQVSSALKDAYAAAGVKAPSSSYNPNSLNQAQATPKASSQAGGYAEAAGNHAGESKSVLAEAVKAKLLTALVGTAVRTGGNSTRVSLFEKATGLPFNQNSIEKELTRYRQTLEAAAKATPNPFGNESERIAFVHQQTFGRIAPDQIDAEVAGLREELESMLAEVA